MQPLRSMSAFVPTVVPCVKLSMSEPSISPSASALTIASPGDCGVEDVLSAATRPVAESNATRSVNVPPVSIPMIRPTSFPSLARRVGLIGCGATVTSVSARAVVDARQVERGRPGQMVAHLLCRTLRVPARHRARDAYVVLGHPRDLLGREPRDRPERRQDLADIADDRAEQAVAARAGDQVVEVPVRGMERTVGALVLVAPGLLGELAHGLREPRELAHLVVGAALGHEARRVGLDEQAELVEIA